MSSFDERTALLVDTLTAAWPQFVSYAELTRLGIDSPAQAVYELELAGHAVEHTRGAVRLEPGKSRQP